ncbi:hypothetical protein [Smaragdicoccus niigatensis]|uniref:hypothetical protein n=1 Tax=Smaragdicoccus niigatensis TaxID=359359 RepID=UPI000365943D|nr:hypothetical protein [Smaragdicoccus niigatensis]
MTQPGYTIEFCDAELNRLSSAAESIALTLVELDSDATWQLLASGVLRGPTSQAWTDIQAMTSELWSGHQLLTDFIARARTARGSGRRFGRDEILDLSRLLFGESIELSSSKLAVTERSLLAPRTQTIRLTPSALLARLEVAFEQVRNILAKVAGAWQWQMPRLGVGEAEVRDLRSKDPEGSAAVARAANAFGALVEKVGADPLGTAFSDFDVVEELLAQARMVVSTAAELAARLAEIRSQATGLLDGIRAVHSEALTAHEMATAKIAGFCRPIPTAPDPGLADELAAVGSELQTRSSAGGARLLAWQSRAKCAYDQAVADRDASIAPVRERAELRGRLDAYKAKAHRFGLAESPQLARMAARAQNLLYTAPCDLDAARSAVSAYVAAVTSATASSDAVGGGQ